MKTRRERRMCLASKAGSKHIGNPWMKASSGVRSSSGAMKRKPVGVSWAVTAAIFLRRSSDESPDRYSVMNIGTSLSPSAMRCSTRRHSPQDCSASGVLAREFVWMPSTCARIVCCALTAIVIDSIEPGGNRSKRANNFSA